MAMTVYDLIPLKKAATRRYSLPIQLSNEYVMPELVYFIQKITFQAGIDCRTALVALIYLNRAKKFLPKGAVGGYGTYKQIMCCLLHKILIVILDTCHRLFLGSILLASKFLQQDDNSDTVVKIISVPSDWQHYYTSTSLYSSFIIKKQQLTNRDLSLLSGGLFSLTEINQLERSFLKLIHYQCWVNDQDINAFIMEHRVDFCL